MLLKLSVKAAQDLFDIAIFTLLEFGENQQIKYEQEFENLFNQLKLQPHIGKQRADLKPNLYSITIHSHVVFYEIGKHEILITRILHGHSDIPNKL